MPKRHGSEENEGAPEGDDREPRVTPQRPAWRTGHLPRMPRPRSDDEPGFVTGWLRERSLDGLFEDQADDPQPRMQSGAATAFAGAMGNRVPLAQSALGSVR